MTNQYLTKHDYSAKTACRSGVSRPGPLSSKKRPIHPDVADRSLRVAKPLKVARKDHNFVMEHSHEEREAGPGFGGNQVEAIVLDDDNFVEVD